MSYQSRTSGRHDATMLEKAQGPMRQQRQSPGPSQAERARSEFVRPIAQQHGRADNEVAFLQRAAVRPAEPTKDPLRDLAACR